MYAFNRWRSSSLLSLNALSANEPIHVINVRVNVSLNDDHQMVKYHSYIAGATLYSTIRWEKIPDICIILLSKMRKNLSTMGNIFQKWENKEKSLYYGEYFSNSPLWGIFFQFPTMGNIVPIPHYGEYFSYSPQWGIFIPKTKKFCKKGK